MGVMVAAAGTMNIAWMVLINVGGIRRKGVAARSPHLSRGGPRSL